jgi:hypothetical protein
VFACAARACHALRCVRSEDSPCVCVRAGRHTQRVSVQAQTEHLEDLVMDVPLSASILGSALAVVIAAGALPLSALEGLLEKVESVGPKRKLILHLMKKLAGELGQDGAAQMVKESGMAMGVLLDADAEIDPGMPSVFDWVKVEGLEWLPLNR